ncbi:MAG: helix-hairpin-helix domain-containing protein [Opitutae bacterium]
MAILKKFGSWDGVRRANLDELQKVEGIGPKLAVRLHEFLHQSNLSSKRLPN